MKNKNKLSYLLLVLVVAMSGANAFAAGPAAVNLGTAGNFVILSKTGISTTGVTQITGDIGVSPVAATYITGFGLSADATNVFSTSPVVTGKIYAANYADPTSSNLTSAVGDMQTAYTDAAGRTLPTATELGAGDISGLTIAPGLYKWGTGVAINSDVTLSGGPNDVWIFQIAQGLNVASGKKVILTGGAQAKNIFWQVGSNANIGTTAQFNGNLLTQTAINLQTGATLNGRALAQTAVTLDANAVMSTGNFTQPSVILNPTPTQIVTPAPAQTPSQTTIQTPTQNQTTYTTSGSASGINTSTQSPTIVTSSVQNTQTIQAQINVAQAFDVSLTLGSSGADVLRLQQYLNNHGYTVSSSGLGSKGTETSLFGPKTKAALKSFQEAHRGEILTPLGLQSGTGMFGLSTRGYINSHR